jgi:hypothetical protein
MSTISLFWKQLYPKKDDLGLLEFYKDYYPFPLYRDVNQEFFAAFGNRTIFADSSWSSYVNPLKLWRSMKDVKKRFAEKNITGNLKGDGLVAGGVIVFGKDGAPKYQYLESTGTPLETEDIVAALQSMQQQQQQADDDSKKQAINEL